MIDQRLLRTDLDGAKAALSRRGDPNLLEDLDHAARLDVRLRDIQAERDEIRAKVNMISKEVGLSRRDGKVDEAEALQAQSRELGGAEKSLAGEHDEVSVLLNELLLGMPNIPHSDAPDGATDADNPIITGPVGLNDTFPDWQRVPHWETAQALGILDNERATKISGAMFTMQRGAGATMARALTQFGLDRNADVHEEVRPPSLVTTATLTATGQLPKFADDAYSIERDDLWCVPTAEASLTSLFSGEVLDDTDLPVRLMAFSPSFRREAGSAGRDTRGMLRTHEFDKVEMLAFATPEQAPALLDDMVGRAASAMADLGLPYRVIEICTGDMGQSHHRTFDVEVYAPGVDTWLEVSSVSWFGDYQARRGNTRFRRHDENGKPVKGSEFVHTLNGSALAVPRVWAAIIENYRNDDGSVTVPEVLHPYMRNITVIRSD
ncbi:serine--tRNA ligase [uncultured Ilumatobacter sp.]|uniref:serine--tRNA ligase n=1 Tax=uncultured Ilumatobacter sp. TaxID=879968 RepID=UPI00374FBD85